MGLIGVIAPFRLEVGFGLASIFFKDFFFSSFGCKGESLKIFLRTIIQNRFYFKGGSYASHFMFENYVGQKRIRHRTTMNLNDVIFNRF